MVLYMLNAPQEREVFRKSPLPQPKRDAHGKIMYEKWLINPNKPQPLLDFPHLPDQIGSNEHWFYVEAWRRFEPRARWKDIAMRIYRDGRGRHHNNLQMEISRNRSKWGLVSWLDIKLHEEENQTREKALALLSADQIRNNTTRGTTPGLIHPELGEAGGRIPNPVQIRKRKSARDKAEEGSHSDDKSQEECEDSGKLNTPATAKKRKGRDSVSDAKRKKQKANEATVEHQNLLPESLAAPIANMGYRISSDGKRKASHTFDDIEECHHSRSPKTTRYHELDSAASIAQPNEHHVTEKISENNIDPQLSAHSFVTNGYSGSHATDPDSSNLQPKQASDFSQPSHLGNAGSDGIHRALQAAKRKNNDNTEDNNRPTKIRRMNFLDGKKPSIAKPIKGPWRKVERPFIRQTARELEHNVAAAEDAGSLHGTSVRPEETTVQDQAGDGSTVNHASTSKEPPSTDHSNALDHQTHNKMPSPALGSEVPVDVGASGSGAVAQETAQPITGQQDQSAVHAAGVPPGIVQPGSDANSEKTHPYAQDPTFPTIDPAQGGGNRSSGDEVANGFLPGLVHDPALNANYFDFYISQNQPEGPGVQYGLDASSPLDFHNTRIHPDALDPESLRRYPLCYPDISEAEISGLNTQQTQQLGSSDDSGISDPTIFDTSDFDLSFLQAPYYLPADTSGLATSSTTFDSNNLGVQPDHLLDADINDVDFNAWVNDGDFDLSNL
ncbi:MAG: hypothetical protein Q9181_005422 [Wetmoreana brouardii]